MNLEPLTHYGLPGAILAAVVWLLYTLIKRGLKVKIEAEIPPK
jgi:hypothetical protein